MYREIVDENLFEVMCFLDKMVKLRESLLCAHTIIEEKLELENRVKELEDIIDAQNRKISVLEAKLNDGKSE